MAWSASIVDMDNPDAEANKQRMKKLTTYALITIGVELLIVVLGWAFFINGHHGIGLVLAGLCFGFMIPRMMYVRTESKRIRLESARLARVNNLL